MLLVAYLRRLGAHGQLTAADRSLLDPMIRVSDNAAADRVHAIVGDSGLKQIARLARMENFQAGGVHWGLSWISAADQARFFYFQDRYIPHHLDGYARFLLSHIQSDQAWGIAQGARGSAFRVFFKGGWLPSTEGLVNQGARLEKPRHTFALAVLTTGNPSMLYGEKTLQGVAARLLRRG